jgi:hypothetical protein
MNAVEFVKKFGWDYAKRSVFRKEAPYAKAVCVYNGKLSFSVSMGGSEWALIDDLKRLVESYELAESYGGLAMAKRQYLCFTSASESVGVNQSPRVLALGKAIADVEKCQ